jgi:signal transduction histidine kinase
MLQRMVTIRPIKPYCSPFVSLLLRLLLALIYLGGTISYGKGQSISDTTQLIALYDRCLEFDETNLDSILLYAEKIEQTSQQLSFKTGGLFYNRLKGIHAEMSGDYENAARYYLLTLEEARQKNLPTYESAALADLAILYSNLKQPQKAKEIYLSSVALAEKTREIYDLTTAYGNLGAIYNQLNQPDSALLYLRRALSIFGSTNYPFDKTTIYNNIGNVYFALQNLDSALFYFNQNKVLHEYNRKPSDLWVDYLNLSYVYIEKEKFDSAEYYANAALQQAIMLQSKSKEADSYALFTKLYEKQHRYPEAFTYQQRWYSLDTALVNGETNQRIADLQEKFNAQKREIENQSLKANIEQNKLQQKATALLALAFLFIAIATAWALQIKRKSNAQLAETNQKIIEKNEKLALLNQEKNALISIVSHDLSSPFVNIMMWAQLLELEKDQLNPEQKTAINRILQSAHQGESLIRHILNVEKLENTTTPLQLNHFNLYDCIQQIITDFRERAVQKNIRLELEVSHNESFVCLSEERLVRRIVENLLSNALKFSDRGTQTTVSLKKEKQSLGKEEGGNSIHYFVVSVTDEGPGIAPEKMPNLFTKYSNLGNKPTGEEGSTGLGLFIVKRLADEINATIRCQSEWGKGTTFSLYLPEK